ncbi:ferritin-like domain-containing protein [Saccharothrix stipae]
MTTTVDQDAVIVARMGTSDGDLDIEWLKKALQHAMILELATIPPYSCGLWSIMDPARYKDVHSSIREIIFDEMSHMALVGNMLNAIGGTPVLAEEDVVPRYPGPLPGGVRPELEIHLAGLTRSTVEMYSLIEEPDEPIVSFSPDAPETYTSIGAFYRKIKTAFKAIGSSAIQARRQIVFDLSLKHGKGNAIIPMADLDTVLKCLDIIMEQGEATSTSPENPHYLKQGELSHYYAFRELYHGRKLQRVGERWSFTGAKITMPRTYAAAEVPPGGWAAHPTITQHDPKVLEVLHAFNREYSGMLRTLQTAWGTDDPATAKEQVTHAIAHMGKMRQVAQTIMAAPLPDNSGWHYCPEYRFTRDAQ